MLRADGTVLGTLTVFFTPSVLVAQLHCVESGWWCVRRASPVMTAQQRRQKWLNKWHGSIEPLKVGKRPAPRAPGKRGTPATLSPSVGSLHLSSSVTHHLSWMMPNCTKAHHPRSRWSPKRNNSRGRACTSCKNRLRVRSRESSVALPWDEDYSNHSQKTEVVLG